MISFAALRSRSAHPLSLIAGALSILIGALVLLGWRLNDAVLKSLAAGWISMKPNAALAFLLTGGTLILSARRPESNATRRAALGGAAGVTAIGALTCLEYVMNWDFGVDQWLFREPMEQAGSWPPGRMGLNTALCLLLLGGALLSTAGRSRRSARFSEGLTLGAMLLAFIAALGYLYHDPALYGISAYTPMALHTALTLLVTGIGTLALHPGRGLMAAVRSEEAGGYMIRRLLPGVLLGLPALGWLRLYGEQRGWYGPSMGLAIFATAATVTLFVLLLWTARSMNDTDLRRRQVAAALEQAVADVIAEGKDVTYDLKPNRDDPTAVGTREMADAIITRLQR